MYQKPMALSLHVSLATVFTSPKDQRNCTQTLASQKKVVFRFSLIDIYGFPENIFSHL